MTIGLCVVFNSAINRNLKSSNVTERGSDGSAAGGRASDLSDWQRSIADAAACRQGRYRAPQQDREVTIINALCTYCQRRHAADKLEFDRMEGMIGYLYCIRYAEGVMPVRFLNWRQK